MRVLAPGWSAQGNLSALMRTNWPHAHLQAVIVENEGGIGAGELGLGHLS